MALYGTLDAIDPARGRLSGNSGYYAIADGLLYAAPDGDKAGLSGWLRNGFADRINAIESAITGGLVYTAPARPDGGPDGLPARNSAAPRAERLAESGGTRRSKPLTVSASIAI